MTIQFNESSFQVEATMDNSNLIRELRNHVLLGQRDAYTEPLLNLAYRLVIERNTSLEQQAQLTELIKELATLPSHRLRAFPGSTCTLF